jgi:predicted peptidase
MRLHPRPFAALALCAALLAPVAFSAAPQSVQSFQRTVTKQVGYRYLLSLPEGYDATAAKTWPLLVFLHGSGERGTDTWLVAKHGPPKLLHGDAPLPLAAPPAAATSKAADTPPAPETPEARVRREAAAKALRENFIVVSPQCPAGVWWDDDAVGALVDEIVAAHKVDPSRLYLTGLSMGGYGTWSYAMRNPGRFAAIIPICGGGEPSLVRRMARAKKAELTSLGIWVFHGAKDTSVPLAESEQMVAALKTAGVTDLQFTVYPEAKHDSWTETYANPEIYAWLLQHRR